MIGERCGGADGARSWLGAEIVFGGRNLYWCW